MALAERISALLKTTLFASTFIAFFIGYLPWTLAIRGRIPDYSGAGALRWLAVVPLLTGAYVALRCIFGFAWTGRGTPAPFDPPQALVVTGFYRYVRNPMYLGAAVFVIGETTLFGSVLAGLVYLLICAVCLEAFVLLYEEPALRGKFGDEYVEYCRNVPRWMPRLTPWQKPHSE
jgi:protein-S-isoprenylcysteine O-methyltransferase Ste14